MLKHVASVLLLTLIVRSDSSFIFPDEVSSRYNTGSGYSEDGREQLNSYDNNFSDQEDTAYGNDDSNIHILGNTHYPTNHVLGATGNRPSGHGHNHHSGYSGNYHGSNGGFLPGFGNHHGYDNRPSHPGRPNYGGIVSQSQANAQSTGSGSLASSQSGSQFFNQIAQSAAQSQAQSQGYPQVSSYPFGPSGGSGASSASSAASATSGIVNGVAVASASAAAAAAGSGNGGVAAVSASSSSSSSGSPSGFDVGSDQIPPWYFRNRVAGEDANAGSHSTDVSSSGLNEATIVFSVK